MHNNHAQQPNEHNVNLLADKNQFLRNGTSFLATHCENLATKASRPAWPGAGFVVERSGAGGGGSADPTGGPPRRNGR